MAQTGDTRQRLIATAAALMHERGYTAVGVKDICQVAGVNKGSFYHFFPSKRDLGLAVIDAYWEWSRRELLEPALGGGGAPLEGIRRFFELIRQQAQQAHAGPGGQIVGCLLGNFALELSNRDEVIREKLQDVFRKKTAFFERALSEAVEAGELPDIDTDASAQAIVAYYEGVSVLAKTYNDPALVDRLTQAVVQLLLGRASDRGDRR